MKKVIRSAVVMLSMLPGIAFAAPIFSTDFESGKPAEFGGLGLVQTVDGLPAGSFGRSHLYNDTTLTGAAGATTLGLAGIGAHSSLSLAFDFVAWNSWDGQELSFPSGDFFEVWLDGSKLFSISPNNASGTGNIPAEAVLTFGPTTFGYGDAAPYHNHDAVYRVTLSGLAHSASTANFEFRVSGPGWQGGTDEAFGLDNLSVSTNLLGHAVPEPATWAMMIGGFALVGASLRRRKMAVRFA